MQIVINISNSFFNNCFFLIFQWIISVILDITKSANYKKKQNGNNY